MLKNLDHPLLFVVFVLFAVTGMQALLTWGAKTMGWQGLASLVQHP